MSGATTRWSTRGHASIADYVHRAAGLVFRTGHRATAETVMDDAMKRLGTPDPAAFLERLAADEVAREEFIGELTIGESYFFRDPVQFQVIRSRILPGLRGRSSLRMWSAGCAAGEEPYSLAILAEEEGMAGRTRIVGTDISRARLEAARRAVYRRWALRGVAETTVERWFRRRGDAWALSDPIREAVDFAYLNLAEDVFPALASGVCGMDLILCRNVLIYFDRDTVAEVCRRLVAALADDGWLLMGASDPSPRQYVACEAVLTGAGLAYRPAGTGRRESQVAVAADVGRDADEAPWVAPEAVPASATPASAPSVAAPPPEAPAAAAPPRDAPASPSPGSSPSPSRTSPPGDDVAKGPVPDGGDAPVPAGPDGALERARAAYGDGDYGEAARMARHAVELGAGSRAWKLQVRALANRGNVAAAADVVERALEAHGDDPELAYLAAALAAERGQAERAVRAARRALYLDRDMILAHVALARGLSGQGEESRALRSYRTALRFLEALPSDADVPGADGETAGRLRRMVAARVAVLERAS